MKKILCITNSYPVHPRLQKIGSLFADSQVYYFAWNRDNRTTYQNQNHVHVYSSKNGYGTAIKMLIGVPGFVNSLLRYLKNNSIDIIVIRHWSTCFILLPFLKKKYYIIYDMNDMPDSLNERMIPLYRYLEKFVLKRADTVILSSSFYIKFYQEYTQKIVILENKVDKSLLGKAVSMGGRQSEKLNIVFVGMIRYINILVNLIEATNNLEVNIHFYGQGIDSETLRSICKEYANTNIYVHGMYKYNQISNIYNEADLVFSAYPDKNENVKYSIPNKFFECLHFEKPLIVSKNTALGELVESNNLGFTVDPYSPSSIKQTIESVIHNSNILNKKVESIKKYKISNDVYWDSYIHLIAEKIYKIS